MLPELSSWTIPVDSLDRDSVREMLTMASAAASIVTTRKGALKSMPEPGEIEAVVGRNKVE